MTVTTTDRTVLDTTDTDPTITDITTEVRATTFPRRAAEHSPNLATLDMLRSTGRNPLLLWTRDKRVAALQGIAR